MPGQMLGTARFMSPEQVEDARESDVRSDVYSLGCTLYFLLRAKAPYSGETVAHTLMAHISAPVPDLCAKRKDVPKWLGDVFQKMLAKSPQNRFQTMGELVEVVQRHLGEEMTKDEVSSSVLDDEPGTEDEYSKILSGRGDIGASLAEIYLEDEDGTGSSTGPAQPDIPEEFEAPESARPSAVVADDDAPDLLGIERDPPPVSRFGGFTDRSSKSTLDDDVDLASFIDDSDDEDDFEDIDDDDQSDDVQETNGSRLNAEPEDDVPVASLTAAQPFRLDETGDADPANAEFPELNDYVKSKQQARREQERAQARRMRLAGLVVSGVALLGAAVWYFTR